MLLVLTVALSAGATAGVTVPDEKEVPIDVVMVGAVVPGFVIVTNTCADCLHASVTAVGDRMISGAGTGGSSTPGVTVRMG